MIRRWAGILLAIALVSAGCSSNDDADVVTIYSGRTENLIAPILDDFETETGIRVDVRYENSADLALLIAEEGDKTPADVFLSQSPGAIELLDQQGRLAALPAGVLDAVPETVRDDEGHWVGFSGRQRVLVYNADQVAVDELPNGVLELTDPTWQGRVGIAPSNSSFQDFVTAMRSLAGDAPTADWLAGLADNDVVAYPNNSSIVAAVGRGEIDAGLVNHYYNYRAVGEDPDHPGRNHQLDTDDPGSILIVTGAALLEGAGNAEGGTRLIEWLLEEPAQRFFADETFEYPLAAGVAPAAGIPPAEFVGVSGLSYGDLGVELNSTRDMITDAGLDG